MKILLFAKQSGSVTYYGRRIIEELKKRSIFYDEMQISNMVLSMDNGTISFSEKNVQNITSYDFILSRWTNSFQLYRFALAQLAQNEKIPMLNGYNILHYCGNYNKFTQTLSLVAAHVPLLPSHFISESPFTKELMEENNLHFPLVFKHIYGYQGAQVWKVENRDEAEQLLEKFGRKLMIQPFENLPFDVRILIVNGNIIGGMKRTGVNDFRHNVSLGAKTERFEVTEEMKNIALQATKAVFLDYSGVDLVFVNNNWYVLEVNAFPDILGFEQATGLNAAGAICDFVLEKGRK